MFILKKELIFKEIITMLHGFAKVSKNFKLHTDLKIILFNENNYIGISSLMINAAKSFDILTV